VADSNAKVSSLLAAFPGLTQDTTEVAEEIHEEDVFYLWDTKEVIFKIYKIARNYLSEYYALDSAILIELIKENKVSMESALSEIPYIHSGYLNIILEEKENGRTDTES
jgi:hypothetical protein